jgi:hypothetical protein
MVMIPAQIKTTGIMSRAMTQRRNSRPTMAFTADIPEDELSAATRKIRQARK